MRQIESINRELVEAEKVLDKWKMRVLALKTERSAVMADLNARFKVDVV